MKLVVAGSRGFDDYGLLKETLDSLDLPPDTIIISGGAPGADRLGARYGYARGFMVVEMPAAWRADGHYNPRAGLERNKEMAQYGDALVAFNMGTPGTSHMVRTMRRLGKPVHEVKVGPGRAK